MAATTNIHQVTASIAAAGEGLERALCAELAVQAQKAAVLMKKHANARPNGGKPAGTGALVQSIMPVRESDTAYSVGPGTGIDYAVALEKGRGPGKGLPRWADPEAADIKAWLDRSVFRGRRRARKNSKRAVQDNLELRDRYQGLAWHVRHFGIKPHPFAAPTAQEMREMFPRSMELAARRFLAAQGAGGAA